MFILPNKYLGAFAELTTEDNKLLTSGKIKKIGEDFIEIVNGFHSEAIRVEEGTVKLNIKSGVSPAIFLTGKIYLPDHYSYRLINIELASEGDKRSFFRLPTNDYIEVDTDSKEGSQQALMKDISLGGMMIETMDEYYLNELIHMQLLTKTADLHLNGKIVRVKKSERGTYMYGVAFLTLSSRESDTLCNYIFDRQKAEINRLKNV